MVGVVCCSVCVGRKVRGESERRSLSTAAAHNDPQEVPSPSLPSPKGLAATAKAAKGPGITLSSSLFLCLGEGVGTGNTNTTWGNNKM